LKVESSTAQKVCAVITTNKQQANGEKPSNIATTNRLLRERRPSVVEKNKNKNREGEGVHRDSQNEFDDSVSPSAELAAVLLFFFFYCCYCCCLQQQQQQQDSCDGLKVNEGEGG